MNDWIDLHLHLLPGVDDGPDEIAESVAMARGLAGLGFGHLVATPHLAAETFEATRDQVETAYGRLLAALAGDPAAPTIDLGREYYFDRMLIDDLVEERIQSLGRGTRAFLFEFPMEDVPSSAREVLFRAQLKGWHPVLAHPERNARLGRHLAELDALVEEGVAPVVNLGSLAGLYGRKIRRIARRILDRGLAVALASDAHAAAGGVAAVEDGLREVEKRWGGDALQSLLTTGPRRLLGPRGS